MYESRVRSRTTCQQMASQCTNNRIDHIPLAFGVEPLLGAELAFGELALGAALDFGAPPLPFVPPNLGVPLAGFGAGSADAGVSAGAGVAVTSCRGCNCTGDEVTANAKVKNKKALVTMMNKVQTK
jgi:hypothetical protein